MLCNMLRIVFLLISYLTHTIQSDAQQEVVLSCLRFYRPKLAVIFTCRTRQDKVKMHKMILAEGLGVRLVFSRAEGGVLAKINTKKYEKLSYFLDMGCKEHEEREGAADILKEAAYLDKFGRFRFLYSWHLMAAENGERKVFDLFQTFNTRMDMDVKLFCASGNNSFNIYEIFNPGINVGVKMRPVGKLINGKIILYRSLSFYEQRKNMSGVLIRSAGVASKPYKTTYHEYMIDPKLMKYDIYSKFHYQLFLGLAEMHEFDFNVTRTAAWFGNTSSGEDGGLAKLLWDDDIDIANTGCMIQLLYSDRIFFYDYIMPAYKFRSYFYFRNPGVVKPNFVEVFKPFSRESWIVTLYVLVIVCVCIEISYYMEQRISGDKRTVWFPSLFVVTAVFSQQGLDDVPKNVTGRIIFLHLLICTLLLYNYYTSSLVSSLISTEPETLKTIKELLESNLKVGIEIQPYTLTYMITRVKQDPYLDLLNKTKIFEHDTPNYLTVQEGIELVHKGGFALHAESVGAYRVIADTFEQQAICDMAQIIMINTVSSLMTQKKSQYTKMFQISLRSMWQTGIIRKLHKTWVTGKPECLSSARIISVSINDMFFPYFLLAVGMLLSILVLLLEVLWKGKHRGAFKRAFSPPTKITYTN